MSDDKFAVWMIIGCLVLGGLVIWVLAVFGTNEVAVQTYTICRPNGYEVVCFGRKGMLGDSDLSCLPLSQVGGRCQ